MIPNLKRIRKQLKISQKDLANYLKVSQAAISHWESGKDEPDLTTLRKIADFFNVSIDQLSDSAINDDDIMLASSMLMKLDKEDQKTAIDFIKYLYTRK